MSSAGCPFLALDRQSSVQTALTAVCVAVAAIVPWALPASSLVSFALASLCVAIVLLAAWRAGWIGVRFGIQSAVWDTSGEWRVAVSPSETHRAVLASSTRVMSTILWLHWKTPIGDRQMLLIRWIYSRRANRDAWRRLIVRLKLQGSARGPQPEEGRESQGASRVA